MADYERALTGGKAKAPVVTHRKMSVMERFFNCLLGRKDRILIILPDRIIAVKTVGNAYTKSL